MSYLDTNKSVIISSPAGSGKTEKLARRYIALLKAGVDVERILAITFTEKASAEMKQSILRILKDEEEALFKKVLEKVSLMRVSTIHAFCATLLRRFSFETKVTPNYQIEEAISARILWEEILYEILMESQESEVRSQKSEARRELILKTIAEKGFRGLENLKDSINYLYEKAPFSLEAEVSNPPHSPFDKGGMGGFLEELKNWPGAKNFIDDYEDRFESYERLKQTEDYFLTDSKLPRKRNPKELKGFIDFQAWAERMHAYWRYIEMLEGAKRAERINDIFKRCYAKYKDKKSLRGVLDFSDLEYLAYKLLMEDPEWANVLYAFDEKTDHILVDEFQDTNNFQWAIIDRLTEEWRSGLGAKREEGTRPTMFLVGDEKQSIYFFRRANVEVFSRAKNKLKEWLGEEFYYEEVKENYRSLPPIIDFTNHLFSRLMNADKESPSWKTRYEPMAPQIASPDASKAGGVEMLLLEKGDDELTAEIKEKEAEVIARRIKTLVGTEVFDRRANQLRQCQYADIALLLRKRTHLKKYEDALREYEIPFVAVKGIGFYQEPEVAMLSAFIYFLSNPKDDYSLYVLLRSPLFMMDEEAILSALNDAQEDAPSDMFSRLKLQNPKPKTQNPIYNTIALLEECLMKTHHMPLAELIEDVLVQTNAWQYFHEPQRKGNVKKFIRIIEGLEADGRPLLAIRDVLERTSYKEDEPKANVNTEGMNAVKIKI
ncbi:MAG: UvrD-helicase domain-containing protein [Nitrospirae bacterium]|nr:UvrD-helicase domain-containing protein [Nitrospirota bacterium]